MRLRIQRWMAVLLTFVLICPMCSGITVSAEDTDEVTGVGDEEAITDDSVEMYGEEEDEEGEEVLTGLVVGYPGWDDETQSIIPESDWYGKDAGVDAKMDDSQMIFGIMDEEGNLTLIPIDQIDNFTIQDEDGNPVEDAEIRPAMIWSNEVQDEVTMDGIFTPYFEQIGNYTLTYTDGEFTDSISLHSELPFVAYYSSESPSIDTLIGNRVAYKNYDKTVYINKLDRSGEGYSEEVTLNNARVEQKVWSNYITITPTETGYKLVVDSRVNPDYIDIVVEARVTNSWEEEDGVHSDSYENEYWLTLYNNGNTLPDNNGLLCFDGGAVSGFVGQYLSKEQFENPEYMWNLPGPGDTYLVHAPTIQEVIDKLSEIAIGENATGYIDDADGNPIKADNLNIVNTGYIMVSASYTGDEEIEPQYVASSGNLNGIYFNSSGTGAPYNIKVDDVYTAVTGKSNLPGEYIEMPVMDPYVVLNAMDDMLTDSQKDKMRSIMEENGGLAIYKGNIYSATRHTASFTNRDMGEETSYYYSLTNADSFVSEYTDDEIFDAIDSYIEAHDEERLDPRLVHTEWIQGLHVNVYCDMMFYGNMGNLVIGYPDKSLTDGEYHKVAFSGWGTTINGEEVELNENALYEINGPDSFPEKAAVGQDLWDGEYNFRTYAIDSALDVEGTASGVKAITPEPNALSEMSYAQKDAVESGAKMTVDMKVDTVDPSAVEDAEAKTAIEAIEQATGKTAANLQFLDFDITASVDGVAGSTKITETKVPFHITFTPKSGYDSSKEYRIARYHNGEVEYLDKVDSLYGEVAGVNMGFVDNGDGTLSMHTDKFSMYALVAMEEEATTTAESTTAASTTASADSNAAAVSPKTADPYFGETMKLTPMVYLVLMGLSLGAAAVITAVYSRKKKQNL
ncbi:MAG: hypothetical protein IJ079_08025 [Lachnospiraceae bacterium]|nr:hypothetical protein [Lachnospiraceae bacterium]